MSRRKDRRSVARICTAVWVMCLVDTSPVLAVAEYRLGGEQGNPWEVALSPEAAGSFAVLDSNGVPLRRMRVGATPHGESGESLVDFSSGSIQPLRVDPRVNLVLAPEVKINDWWIPLLYTGGTVHWRCFASRFPADLSSRDCRNMLDGDASTALYLARAPSYPPVVVDFGHEIPVHRLRFYPRLGRIEDARQIAQMAAPVPPLEAFGEDSFAENFPPGFEISVAGSDLPVPPCDLSLGVNPWTSVANSYLQPLRAVPENLDVVVDWTFNTRFVRWLVLQVVSPRAWEIAELEVYGEGFVRQTAFTTAILDFGRPVVWGTIGWRGQQPPGTSVEIRTRTGNTADPYRYFDRDANGSLREITAEEYADLEAYSYFHPDQFFSRIYDAENWSFWSPPYAFEAGLRGASCPADCSYSGTRLLSPRPSRYLQIAIRFSATIEKAPQLDELVIQFDESLLAQEVVGEIWPTAVESFRKERFCYTVRPVFQEDNTGFDRLEIITHFRVDTIASIKLDGTEVDQSRFPVEIRDDRIVVSFPRLAGPEDSAKKLEVIFDVEVLRFGTEFTGWVYDSTDPLQIKQQIRPGNATYEFSGDVLAVETPLGRPALIEVEAAPNPFTPNGDGINDVTRISYKIHDLTQERPVALTIYDLAGRRVRVFPVTRATMGKFSYEWDGCDDMGRRVFPGVYLFELSLGTGESTKTAGALFVAY